MHRTLSALLLLLPTAFAGAGTAGDVVAAAKSQIGVTVRYDPSYQRIAYPGGDVPIDRGVCTDVVIRAYRKAGIDLQPLVHRDMAKAWRSYPRNWGLKSPDKNIDHRRVPNLATFFSRHGSVIAAGKDVRSYLPGDLVTWLLPGGLPHIGIVAEQKSTDGVPLVIHNIGAGTRMQDQLFSFPITGHYRFPKSLP